jgi:hypothetical protein
MAGMEIIPELSTLLIGFAVVTSMVLLTMTISIVIAQLFDGLFDG